MQIMNLFNHNKSKFETQFFKLLPSNLESLILSSIVEIRPEIGFKLTTIKKLSLDFGLGADAQPNSLPPNVTSISLSCPKITDDKKDGKFFSIPNTIRKLKFNQWYNEGFPLNKDDIPDGITSLDLGGYRHGYNHNVEGILPNSIKHLKIDLRNDLESTSETQFFKLLPSNLQSLRLHCSVDLTPQNVQPNSLPSSSLTDLSLKNTNINLPIVKGILPNGVKNLKLTNIYGGIEIGAIPNTVTSLLVDFPIYPTGMFAPNLTHLELYADPEVLTYDEEYAKYQLSGGKRILKAKRLTPENINMMFYYLPNSVTTITLPLEFQSYNYIINLKKFKNVYYKDEYFLK